MGGVAQEGFVFRGPVPTFGTTPRAEAGPGGVGAQPPDCGLSGSVDRSVVSGTGLDLPQRMDQRGVSSTPPSMFARAGSPGTRSGLDGGPTCPHSLGSFVGYFRDKAPSESAWPTAGVQILLANFGHLRALDQRRRTYASSGQWVAHQYAEEHIRGLDERER